MTSVVAGNGFRLVSQDAFAAARGEAFAATADNPSAIHYNPAGLTQLAGHHLRAGSYGLFFDPTFRPPEGAGNAGMRYGIDRKFAVAPQLFYTYSLAARPVTFGVGVYSPYGAAVAWPDETGFRSVATEGELMYLRINPVVAVEVLPGLSVAGGIMIDHGDIGLEQGLLRNAQPFANRFRFEGDDISLGFNLGARWEVNPCWSLGATLRSGTTMDFKGKTKIEQQPFIQATSLGASAEFEFPLTAVLGVSWRPNERWNAEINADWTQWSRLGTVTIEQDGAPPFPVQQDIPVTLDWKDSWILKFGVTRYFGDGWRASAGYVFNENSVPTGFYAPTVADLDRHILAIGVGRETEDFQWDVTYQFGYGPDREVNGSAPGSTPALFQNQNADGTYDFVSHALLVSAGWRF
jgi:long-chain fatty acid transport protein